MRLFLVVVNLRKEIVCVNDKSHKICKNTIVFIGSYKPLLIRIIFAFGLV